MDLAVIEVDKEAAEQKYKQYLEATKKRASRQYSQLKRAYRAAAKGFKLIDIYKAFETTGLKPEGTPKLAIVRADSGTAYFHKRDNGSGIFSRHRTVPNWGKQEYKSNVELPEGIFPNWVDKDGKTLSIWSGSSGVETNVPVVPAHLLPEKTLDNYYILFEVDKWSPIAPVGDPYLLERVNENTFIVLAEWDVTEVEASIMRGNNVVLH